MVLLCMIQKQDGLISSLKSLKCMCQTRLMPGSTFLAQRFLIELRWVYLYLWLYYFTRISPGLKIKLPVVLTGQRNSSLVMLIFF